VLTVNVSATALRFFFKVTLKRSDLADEVVSAREPRRLPIVLSPEEVGRLLTSATNIKHKALLSLAYATGLRASQVVSLKLTDIDRERMVIRVEQGKSLPSRKRGEEGSLCHAFAQPSRAVARMVARRAQEGMDASRPALAVSQLSRATHEWAPASPHRSPGSGACGHHQTRRGSYPAAQLCYASTGAKDRYPGHPEPAPAQAGALLGHKKLDTTALYTRVGATTSSPWMSSPLMDGCSRRANRKTPTCSGACVAAAATSASSRLSSIGCIGSAPFLVAGYSIRRRGPGREQGRNPRFAATSPFSPAADEPLCILVEDAQWPDPTTQELLGLLIDRLGDRRVLRLITHRPEFIPPWGTRAHLTQLVMNRLSARACAGLVGDLAHGKALPDGRDNVFKGRLLVVAHKLNTASVRDIIQIIYPEKGSSVRIICLSPSERDGSSAARHYRRRRIFEAA
jgi:integrase